MNINSSIYVAGGNTLIGAAIQRALEKAGYCNAFSEIGEDLQSFTQVDALFRERKPEFVFLAAGKTGGIAANMKYPAELMLDNLLIACNIIECARRQGVKKLLYLASSCSYPRDCAQPMKEASLLTSLLEPTNEAYAIAKIAGIKLCQAYRSQYDSNFIVGIPANAFGPGDDFSEENSHVAAALIRKMDEAKVNNRKQVEIWGTGNPQREFIFINDLADACLFIMDNYDEPEPINLGSGTTFSIRDLAETIKEVVGFNGSIVYDTSKPDGMPIKNLDNCKIRDLGWSPHVFLREGLVITYDWYRKVD
ncbi:MAG: GDP-L-fucose synthase family protein [Syntrophales bacterium]